MPLPHMGWNDVHAHSSECLFKNMANPRFYHLHSYCIIPRQPEYVLARAEYGVAFTAAIRRENVFGTQFHPEKSHQWGIDLLRNFAEL
jgi:glutamine amidotransferase